MRKFDNATVKRYQLPVLINMSFPKTISLAGEGTPEISRTVIAESFVLTVNVLPGPDLKEHLDNVVAFISPLNSVWTFIAAIGAAIV